MHTFWITRVYLLKLREAFLAMPFKRALQASFCRVWQIIADVFNIIYCSSQFQKVMEQLDSEKLLK